MKDPLCQEPKTEEQPSREALEAKPLLQLPFHQDGLPIISSSSLEADRQGTAAAPMATAASRSGIQPVRPEITGKDMLHYFKARRVALFMMAARIQLVMFAALVYLVMLRPRWFIDVAVTDQLQDYSWLRTLMYLVSVPGNVPYLLTAITLLLAVIFWFARQRLAALLMIGVERLTAPLNDALKMVIDRPRPTNGPRISVLSTAHGSSFPSGHVMSYVALWGLLFLLIWLVFKGKARTSWWWRFPALLVCALVVLLIGPSRVYLGDHWATDVIGSYLCEGVVVCLAMALYFKMREVSPRGKLWVVRHLRWRWLGRTLFHGKVVAS